MSSGRKIVARNLRLLQQNLPRADIAPLFRLLVGMQSVSLPQAEVLDRGRQRFGLVRLAVGRDLCGGFLETVVVQDLAIGGCIVVTAHPKADEIPVFWIVSEPASASDLIHI